MKKRFALMGCGGYIAPKHLKAIKDTGNDLVCTLDKSDSVGILDKFFYDTDFFTEFEIFERHVEKLKNKAMPLDYISICTPNYLHDSHIRFALRHESNVICEKPLVINPWNLDALEKVEQESGKNVYGILQLRLHPSLQDLKTKIDGEYSGKKYDVNLDYIASRGKWYNYSWKGDVSKSGGLEMNLGIHFFDMLSWVFGKAEGFEIYSRSLDKIEGYLELEKAKVHWILSSDKKNLPQKAILEGRPTHRSIKVNGEELEFTEGFTDLHTKSYEEILSGKGFRIKDVRPSIDLVYQLRNTEIHKTTYLLK